MNLSTKIAYNTLIQFISKIIATFLGLFTIAFITRYLGQEGFGEYTTATTFLSFFAIIADLGLTITTVQMISKPNVDQDKILGNLLSLRLISAIFFIGLAPVIVLFFPYSSDVKSAVAIASACFILIALNQILIGLFQKNLRMDKVSIAEVANRIFLLATTIFAIKTNMGLNGLMISMVVASTINFILLYLFSKKYAVIKFRFDFDYWKKIISYSWPIALTITFNLVYLRADTLFLSIINRSSKIGIIAEVGIYGAAYKVIDVLITLPFMFIGIILPILTTSWAKKNKKEFNKIIQKTFNFMVIIAIPIAVGAQYTANDIMSLIAGENFVSSGPILKILIWASTAIFISAIFSHVMIAMNKQKKLIKVYFFIAITSVIGYSIAIYYFSYFGAAWVTIYSEVIITIILVYMTKKYSGFFPNISIVIKALIASLIMAGMIYLFRIDNLIISLILSSIIYFISLFLLKGFSKQDILNLLNK